MTKTTTLPIEELRLLLHYDAETGFIYRRSNGARALFTLNSQGYPWGRIRQKYIFAHRAAWAISYGEWPVQLDHINRDRTDSRLCNLRLATSLENAHNTKRFAAGGNYVSRTSLSDRWQVRFQGKYIGCFSCREEADRIVEALLRGESPSIRPTRKYTRRTNNVRNL